MIDKEVELILEIGSCYTKIGFAIEQKPKRIVRLDLLRLEKKSRIHNELYIEEKLYHLFNVDFVYNLKGKSVVYIYNYYQIEEIHNIVGHILFNKYEVNKIYFTLGNVLPLYLSGHYSGIIVDLGYYQSSACAVYDGYSLLHLGGYIGNGGKQGNKLVQKLFLDNLSIDVLEDIAMKHGRILNQDEIDNKQTIRIRMNEIQEYQLAKCYTQNYFGDWNEEESNIAYGLLELILKLKDPEIIRKVCQNIIICGGGRKLRNMIQRLSNEMIQLINTEFKCLKSVKMYITQNVSKNQIWSGASIIVQLGGHERFCVTNQKFRENGNMFVLRSDAYNFLSVK